MEKIKYAEDVNHYWKTGSSTPDSWLDKAAGLIEEIDGHVFTRGFGQDKEGRKAYMITFQIDGTDYKMVWPVLESKNNNDLAARRQATTFMFHDIKAKCMSSLIIGTKSAFFSYLLLPDGRTAAHASIEELNQGIPHMFLPYNKG